VKVAGKQPVQVEKRMSYDECFGQNRTESRQVVMEVEEFVRKMEGDNAELFYLSTQDSGQQAAFQTPCEQLLSHRIIDETLEWAGNLVLHTCNIWMGHSKSGSSSGLHVDHHDNFYLLIEGQKRVRLYSPDCATKMYTYGTIERVYFNGKISFVGNETRADGTAMSDEANSDEETDPEEEEIVLGKGFDYESDADQDGNTPFPGEAEDDFDKFVQNTDSDVRDDDNEDKPSDPSQRPDNFSRIDIARLTEVDLRKDFPDFLQCREYVLELTAGQTLYLPAGWFHEVTSISNPKGQIGHIALNYWYHPPDALDNYENPYKNSRMVVGT